MLAPLDEAAEHAPLGRFFPAAEIPVASTTRRFFRRDGAGGLVGAGHPSEPPGLGEEDLAKRRERQARKLCMAMTRAGRHLVLVSTEPLPAAVQGCFELG